MNANKLGPGTHCHFLTGSAKLTEHYACTVPRRPHQQSNIQCYHFSISSGATYGPAVSNSDLSKDSAPTVEA